MLPRNTPMNYLILLCTALYIPMSAMQNQNIISPNGQLKLVTQNNIIRIIRINVPSNSPNVLDKFAIATNYEIISLNFIDNARFNIVVQHKQTHHRDRSIIEILQN